MDRETLQLSGTFFPTQLSCCCCAGAGARVAGVGYVGKGLP